MMIHVERTTPIIKIKFKTSMIKSSLCDFSDAYILVSETITISNTGTAAASPLPPLPKKKKKNSATFTDSISGLNNTQIDNTNYIHVVMTMHNLI